MCLKIPSSPTLQCCKPITLLDASFPYCSPPPIQCCEPITLPEASYAYCSSPTTILRTHNIVWCKFYLSFLPLYNVANPKHCLTQVLLIVPPRLQCCKPKTLLDASFTYCFFPYTMLWTHNIAWIKFYWLFLNIVQREKRTETQNRLDSSFSDNFCDWL